MKSKNTLVICGWMITELGLKGNELLVYAIIYGFSQDGEDKFEGSLKYLQDWTCSSKNTVLKSLKSLEEKKLILKEEESKNNIKFCKYSVTEPPVQLLNRGGSETAPNIIYIDTINNIVGYLNIVLGSNFKPGVQKTRDLITARLNEGFTEDDFMTVIDKKYKEWHGTEFEKYMRPSTLFGTKFEGYLNQIITTKPGSNGFDQGVNWETV